MRSTRRGNRLIARRGVLAAVGVAMAGSGALVVASAQAAPQLQPGSALATSSVFGVAPAMAGLNLNVTTGTSRATYQAAVSTATAQTLDLGGLGILLTESPICGQTMLKHEQLPTELRTDSLAKADQPPRSNGLGRDQVSASGTPQQAEATSAVVDLDLGGLISLSARSTSSVRFDPAKGGTATSSVTQEISVLGGLIRISGLTWTASQSRASEVSSSTAFTLGQASVHAIPGLPLVVPITIPTSASSAGAIEALNAVLVPLGVTLQLPTESIDPTTGAVTLSGLRVVISGSALHRALSAPLYQAYKALGQALLGNVPTTEECTDLLSVAKSLSGPTDSIVALAAAIAGGSGALTVNLGGAAALVSAPTTFRNPLEGGGSPPTVSTQPTAPSNPVAPQLGLPGSPAAGVPAPPVAGPVELTPQLVAGPLRCISLNTTGASGCSRTYATAAGVLALGLGVALALADLYYDTRGVRRARRRFRR